MQGKGRFVFLGISSFKGRKDPEKLYHSLSLLQGAETFQVLLEEGQQHVFKDAVLYDELEIEFNVSARYDKYKGQSVLSMKLLSVVFVETGEIPDISPEIPSNPENEMKVDNRPKPEKKLKAV